MKNVASVASIVLAAVMSVSAVAVSIAWLRPTPAAPPVAPVEAVEPADHGGCPHVAGVVDAAALRGLWTRYPEGSGREDQPVAFYYFHDGGIGLFRYGRLGANTTNSYNWVVGEHGGQPMIVLTYRKTGEVQHLPIRIDSEGRRTLVINGDPKNPGVGESRYTFVPPPSLAKVAPDLELSPLVTADADAAAPGIDNRLWIDQRPYKTGGMGFQLYQLRTAGIDGRGTGWHHVGDYDDWSTESLSYRILRGEQGPERLDLSFTLRGERHTTTVAVAGEGQKRTLTMGSDPRDYWAVHTFKDGGVSFAGLVAQHASAFVDR
jgi:hypothetical protein